MGYKCAEFVPGNFPVTIRAKNLVKAEKREDDICPKPGEPLVGTFQVALTPGRGVEFPEKCFRFRKCPGVHPSGVGPEPRGIPPVPHIADLQQAVRVSGLQGRFKIPVMHHSGRQVIAQEDDRLALSHGNHGILIPAGTAG